jgi:hypothetical protein
MIRRLLTLIALCAGFATIGAPARAAVIVHAAEQVASATVAASPDHVVRLIGAAPSARLPGRPAFVPPIDAPSRPALTVIVQADRAHE